MKTLRITAVLLSGIMTAAGTEYISRSAFSANDPDLKNTLTVSSVELTKKQAAESDTVTISFRLGSESGDPELAAMGLHVQFPENENGRALSPVADENGNYAHTKKDMILTSVLDDESVLDNAVFVAAAGTSDITSSGAICSMEVKLPEDYAVGDVYPVNIVYVDNASAPPEFINLDGDKDAQNWTFANGIRNGSVTISDREYPLGDVNADNSVDSSDAALILREYADTQAGNTGSFSAEQAALADYNGDDTIDSSDAALILKAYADHQASK